jgi:Fe-S-cluster-containing hydrogenase component 2
MKFIRVHAEKCTGCNQCTLACSFTKTGEFSPIQALLKLLTWEEKCLTVPIVCEHCKNAPCMNVCPVGAIKEDETSHAIVVDSAKCTACGRCTEACPTRCIFLPTGASSAIKCDLCDGEPACVRACLPGALEFEELTWSQRKEQQGREKVALEVYSQKKTISSVSDLVV